MKKILKLTAILLIVAGSFSCGDKEDEFGEPKEISFTEYSLAGTSCQWTNIDYGDKVVVINSNKELEQYVTCTEGSYPEIDFSKNTLVLASGVAGGGIAEITPMLSSISTNKFILHMNILLDFTALAWQNWTISIIVPKMPDGVKINLDVKQSHENLLS
jgi:hypothetical protein